MIPIPPEYATPITNGLDHVGLIYCLTLETLMKEHGALHEALNMMHGAAEASAQPGAGEASLHSLNGLITKLMHTWKSHTEHEEELLFPVIRKYFGIGSGPVHFMEAEHHEADRRFALLAAHPGFEDGALPSERRRAVMEAIETAALLRTHLLKEEQILYPMIQTMLTERDMQQLDASIQQRNN